MKYIKRFNEEVSHTYGNDMVFLKGLEDDIEGIFVQVLDDGWDLDYQLTDYAGNIGFVRLKKESGGESKTIEQLLTYLHHFYDYIKSKGYDFHHIDLFDWICVDYDRSKAAINFGRKDWDFIEQHLITVANGRPVHSISMNLGPKDGIRDTELWFDKKVKNLKMFNESLNEEEVKDFCETHLAYLMDDGLRVLVQKTHFGFGHATGGTTYYKVTLSFRSVTNKKWIDIKDQVIPFLTHLGNGYDLISIASDRPTRFGSYNLEFNIVPEGYGSYPEFFNIDGVISDKFDSHRFNDDYKVLSIQFKIKGEKV